MATLLLANGAIVCSIHLQGNQLNSWTKGISSVVNFLWIKWVHPSELTEIGYNVMFSSHSDFMGVYDENLLQDFAYIVLKGTIMIFQLNFPW